MAARNDQDLILSVNQITGHARDGQDLPLVIELPSSSIARFSQDVMLVVMSRPQQPRIYITQ